MPFIHPQKFACLFILEPFGLDPIRIESTKIGDGVPFASSSDEWLMLSEVDKDRDLDSMIPKGWKLCGRLWAEEKESSFGASSFEFHLAMNSLMEDDQWVCQRNDSLSRQIRFCNPQQENAALDTLQRCPRKRYQPKTEQPRRQEELDWRANLGDPSALVSSTKDDRQSSGDGTDWQSLNSDNDTLPGELARMSLLPRMSETGTEPTGAFS